MILRPYSFWHTASIILILSILVAATQAQTLQFTSPAVNALTALGAGTNYTLGQDVRIAWESGYERTTLRIWQGPRADGSLVGEVLAANRTREENSYTWRAAGIGSTSLTRPVHFELINGAGTASADSSNFYVVRPPVTSTSSSSTSSSATPPLSSTTDVAAAATTTPAPTAGTKHHPVKDRAASLGLGIGLGLGILLIGLLFATLVFLFLRRRQRERNLPRGHHPHASEATARPLMMHQDKSGTLISGYPDSPGHPQIAYFGHIAPGPHHAGRDRNSNGTASTADGSYHGPFPFEAPRPQSYQDDFDSRSIEQEFRSIPRNQQVGVAHGSPARSLDMLQAGVAHGGSPATSLRTGTPPRGELGVHPAERGVRRMTSIDEDGPGPGPSSFGRPPGTPPEWPLRPGVAV